jgi:hypothetical protein
VPQPTAPKPVSSPPPTGILDHPDIPKPGTWRSANAVGFPKPGIDRAFLIDRGWLEGQLLAVDSSSVTMRSGEETFRLPRNQVSLVALSEPYDPKKRNSGNEVRLRVVIEGPAERATLHFTQGALISKVLREPKWVEGADADDKAFTDRTTFSFEKGRDQAITRVEAEFAILLPPEGDLRCEVNNNRANGNSGPLSIKFIDPETDREIAILPLGKHGMWYAFDIAREKLIKPSRTQKLVPIPVKFEASRIPTLRLLSKQAARPGKGMARLVFSEEPARVALLDSIDTKDVCLGGTEQKRIPRERVVWIELLDWQLDMAHPTKDGKKETPPLRWVSYGCSTTNSITLPSGTRFSRMIVPHYCLFGMDSNDSFIVKDERIFQCYKGAMDQSPFHSEMVATLALPSEPAVNLEIANAYTNIWSGHWEFVILQALSNRWIEDFKSGNWELSTSRKIQTSKLMTP